VDVLRFFTRLKCRLMPYVYAAGLEAHEAGVPVLRAMLLEFPHDPACDHLDRQFMLGESLLVAPVFSPDGVVDYYLPAGTWTSFLTGEVLEGGRWVRQTHGYLSLPLLARANAVIPVGANDQQPDYDYADGVTLHVFALEDRVTRPVRIPAGQGGRGARFEVSRAGQEIRVEAREATRPWRVLLRGSMAIAAVDGGAAAADPLGTRLVPSDGARGVAVRLLTA
jgi:alpha-D-xyloside xylohydrolase